MTIASETNRAGPYSCNGVTTSFPYGFKLTDASHIRVVLADATGVETVLTLGTHYTVSGVGNANGGSVTTLSAYTTGKTITNLLHVPFTQEVDLENQGAYYAETVEAALDLAVQRDLQLAEELSRAIKVPVSVEAGGALSETLAVAITDLAEVADEITVVAGIASEVSTAAGIAADIQTVAGMADVLDGQAGAAGVTPNAFVGDDATTAFTLTRAPGNVNNILVFIGGSIQPTSAYAVEGVTLTISPAVASGVPINTFTIAAVTATSLEALATHVGSRDGHPVATTLLSGLMSPEDKKSLNAGGIYVTNYGGASDGVIDCTSAVTAMAVAVGYVRFGAGGHALSTCTIAVPIYFEAGAYIVAVPGSTITITNRINSARQWVLRGSGSYALTNAGSVGEDARQVHASWFGVFPYAGTSPIDQGPLIQAIAVAMGNARESVIEFDVGNYTVQSQVLLTRCCWIRGQGARRTVFRTTTDGFSLFKSNEVGVKVTDCQFEIASPLSSRDYPFVEFGHGECEAYNISAGNTKRSIVLSGNNARVRNITGAWGYSPGAGSSLVEVMGGSGHRISEILAPTSSAYGPEQLVLIGGPNQSATISGVTARDIAGISPSRLVAVVAQGGAISRVDIADIQSNAFAGTPPDVAVLFKTAGTYGLSDVTLRAFEINSFAGAGIRVEQGSSGTTEDIAIDGGNVSGATGNGLEIVRTAGTLKQVKVGAGVDLSERATPVYRSGTSTEVIIAPEAVPAQLGSVCYDLGDIADDTAVSIDLGRVVYVCTVEVALGYTYWGDFVVRAAPSPGATKKAGHANVVGLASALTGTTGTDGNATLGVQASTLYLENRLGSSQRVQLILKTGIR